MNLIELRHKQLLVRVSPQGASLVDAWFDDRPVLRPYAGDVNMPFNSVDGACFPMVPYCGRIEGNTFTIGEQRYSMLPNTDVDKHRLHGDGWLNLWSVLERQTERVRLGLTHTLDSESPYHYEAQLEISVADEQLKMILSVVNRGKTSLPFGLGFHPYFPLTASTTLQFEAKGYRDEREDHLPAELVDIPTELNFSHSLAVPDRFFHLGFENWNARTLISNPELGINVTMQASGRFDRLQIFSPGPDASDSEGLRYVCVEPMTHTCNAHRMRGDHGLQMLEPDQSMQATLTLTPHLLVDF